MLWHKAWLETRGRFFAGLALSLIVGFGVIYDFRATERLLPQAESPPRRAVKLSSYKASLCPPHGPASSGLCIKVSLMLRLRNLPPIICC